MTTKTNQHQTTKTNTTTINRAPEFTQLADPIAVLEMLDDIIETLSKKPDTIAIKRIKKKLGNYQIITVQSGEQHRWITGPPEIKHTVTKNTFGKRVAHLIKSGGIWLDPTGSNSRLNFSTAATIPFKVPVTGQIQQGILSEELMSLTFAVKALHEKITEVLKQEHESTGIFEKPYGITNLNRMKTWLASTETNSEWNTKGTLKTHTLDKVIENAQFTVNV